MYFLFIQAYYREYFLQDVYLPICVIKVFLNDGKALCSITFRLENDFI